MGRRRTGSRAPTPRGVGTAVARGLTTARGATATMRAMLVPGLLMRRATEEVSASALPHAPVRPVQRRSRSAVTRLSRRRAAPAPWADALLDEADWYIAAAGCSDALHRWWSAPPWERAAAYAAYHAALDREEAAGRELGRAAQRRGVVPAR